VHLQAAAMFDRHDLQEESAREHALLRRMQPAGASEPATSPVDLRDVNSFMGEVERVLQALDGAAPAGKRKDEGSGDGVKRDD
jgi:hypothetical protein